MGTVPSPDFRRKVETVIDRYVGATEAVAAPVSVNPQLPLGGQSRYILQLDSAAEPQWLRKLTFSDSAPNDDDGNDGDIWIET